MSVSERQPQGLQSMSTVLIGEILSVTMFAATIGAVLAGYPVAFTLAGVGLVFATLGIVLGVFDVAILSALVGRYFGTMTNETLVAVPLFVFMGVMLERSKIAEALLTTMGELFGALRGGLGYSVVIVGALLAASTGIVGATVVTMGLLSLPAMMRAGYDPKLAAGTICAAGTLGQIIPPSTVLIFVGDILQGANQQAQLELGNLSPDPISVGQLFAGAMIPGLVLVGLYLAWILLKSIFDPKSCPPLEMSDERRAGLAGRVVKALAPPLLLILAVLGSILAGIATPTESASVGAVGAMLLSAANRSFSLPILREVMRTTLTISSMVFVILLGASVFSLVFRGLGGENLVHDALSSLPGGTFSAVLAVMLVIFFLGFFLDTFEIIFVVVPIAAPGADQDGRRSGLAGGDDRRQPADQLPDAAVRVRAVLPARRGGEDAEYHRDLPGRGAVRGPAGARAGIALGVPEHGDLPAGPAVRARGAAGRGCRPERARSPVGLARGGRFR